MDLLKKIQSHLDKLGHRERNSIRLFIIAVCIVLIFLFIICPILINKGMDDCVSFWTSFSGTLATIFVGWLTIRLTKRIEARHQEDEKLQKKMTIIQSIPDMYCKKASLYSFNDGDYFDGHISKFPKMNHFCIYLKMAHAFPQYLKITISQMQLNRKLDKKYTIALENKDYSFTNNKTFELYINVPKQMDDVVSDLYTSHLKTTNVTLDEEKKFFMSLRFRCDNTLLPQINGVVEFCLSFDLENMGHFDSCVKLHATNIQFLETSNNKEVNQ